ncbi:MAG: hypothetical protein H6581_05645 [Bacteroidia bacterium]|nr:hypothetical protein [Bacteroidia bacterium]
MKPIKFAALHLGLTAVLLVLAWFLVSSDPGPREAKFSLIAISITSLTSLIGYFIVYNSLESNPKMFTGYLMGSVFIKMFTGIAGIFLVSWKISEMAIPFAVSFLGAYLVFTGLEVFFLMKKARES